MRLIGPEAEAHLTWSGLMDAIEAGHALPRAQITDSFLYRGDDTMLNRAAWINGLGLLVKTATITPGNPARDLPTVNGAVSLFDDKTGQLSAVIDFHLVTKWKTVGDSLLAARHLARSDSREILIAGAGTVGRGLYEAYRSQFPDARIRIWNRSAKGAEAFIASHPDVAVAHDLEAAVRAADIVTCATMSTDPLIHGGWLQPGTHLDLIGAYRPDMREADDAAIKAGRLFVDSRATTVGHIGEIEDPLQRGVIAPDDIVADYYDLASGAFARRSPDEITVFKNGGGAHLDLMTAHYVLGAAQAAA